jgi:hypothetical protein
MTPMARGVAYGQKHRFFLGPGLLKGILAPGVPINGIIGVLQKVRALL